MSKPFQRQPAYYTARSSTLDRAHLNDSNNPFRGFFTLFWLAMASFVVSTFSHNYQIYGSILSLRLINLLAEDILVVLLMDIMMILSIFPVWGWAWLVSKNVLPYPLEMAIQHGYQTTWFLSVLYIILDL
jgi:sterol O-acyltransferase